MLFLVLYGMYQGIPRSVGNSLAADFQFPSRYAQAVSAYMATTDSVWSLHRRRATMDAGHPAVLYGAVFAALGVIALFGLVSADGHGHHA